ncbi:hypothetical protein [Actinomycetospora sp. NBRC 106378]|uniref:hypothetical protein n=1 Tax=Actinomycetospora sp. NBRC 106378 TaxID=3032208 RepID=UPI0024A0D985|nr:hypothetical protein [Actinomycetospora sp. NBRC 106378]GLZ51084.1 hypothetical protein Acsp07_07010 [Actinomycetospora sp. NBRC 106378]
MALNSRTVTGRLAGGLLIAAGLVGFGGGVANAEEAPSGAIQEVGSAVSGVEEATGVAAVSDELGDATGLTDIENELGITKAEEGLGL